MPSPKLEGFSGDRLDLPTLSRRDEDLLNDIIRECALADAAIVGQHGNLPSIPRMATAKEDEAATRRARLAACAPVRFAMQLVSDLFERRLMPKLSSYHFASFSAAISRTSLVADF
jgi:hypothetical protein